MVDNCPEALDKGSVLVYDRTIVATLKKVDVSETIHECIRRKAFHDRISHKEVIERALRGFYSWHGETADECCPIAEMTPKEEPDETQRKDSPAG